MPQGFKAPVKKSIRIYTGLILKNLMAPSRWDWSRLAAEPGQTGLTYEMNKSHYFKLYFNAIDSHHILLDFFFSLVFEYATIISAVIRKKTVGKRELMASQLTPFPVPMKLWQSQYAVM